MTQLFGWEPDPESSQAILDDPGTPVWTMDSQAEGILGVGEAWDGSKSPVILFNALLKYIPEWFRGAQGIGDCVGWGWELAGSLTASCDAAAGANWDITRPFSPISIYAGARVEARGRTTGTWSDGAFGGAAAKWLSSWGALEAKDWSTETGNPDHDLTKYTGDKSKNWGYWGNGGQNDKGRLDEVAKRYKATECRQVLTFEQAAKLIESGYAIAVCSLIGLSDKRDRQGFVRRSGTWAHCMCFSGVRYDRPGLLCTNSWGNSWGLGNFFPLNYSEAVQKCSAWLDADLCTTMLGAGDSYAVIGIQGLKRRKIDWSTGWEIAA